MRQLIATLAGFAALLEQAIHGPDRTVILPFIEQSGINSGGGAILEAFFVQTNQDRFAFHPMEGACPRTPRRRHPRKKELTAIPRVRSATQTYSLATTPRSPLVPSLT